jgi:hypothetical protein
MPQVSPAQAPTAPPAPPAPPVQSASSMLAAMRTMRDQAVRHREQLIEQREGVVGELRGASSATEQASLARRLENLDQRIIEAEQQIHTYEMEGARLGAEAGTLVTPSSPAPWESGPPTEIVIVSLLTVFVFFPLAIAYARRLWNRGSPAGEVRLPADVTARLDRLEAGVDTIAIEVERISEGQRFVTKLLAGEGRRDAIPASGEDRP